MVIDVLILADPLLSQVQYNLATLTVRNLSELTQNNFFPDIITLFDPTRPISEIWENPPPTRHLHVFVQIRDRHQVETAVTALSSPSECRALAAFIV